MTPLTGTWSSGSTRDVGDDRRRRTARPERDRREHRDLGRGRRRVAAGALARGRGRRGGRPRRPHHRRPDLHPAGSSRGLRDRRHGAGADGRGRSSRCPASLRRRCRRGTTPAARSARARRPAPEAVPLPRQGQASRRSAAKARGRHQGPPLAGLPPGSPGSSSTSSPDRPPEPAIVFIRWTLSFVTRGRAQRLITGEVGGDPWEPSPPPPERRAGEREPAAAPRR